MFIRTRTLTQRERVNRTRHSLTHNVPLPVVRIVSLDDSFLLLFLSFAHSIRCKWEACLTSACTNRKLIEFQQITIRCRLFPPPPPPQIIRMQMTVFERKRKVMRGAHKQIYYIGNGVSLLQYILRPTELFSMLFFLIRWPRCLAERFSLIFNRCACARARVCYNFTIWANACSVLCRMRMCMSPSCDVCCWLLFVSLQFP